MKNIYDIFKTFNYSCPLLSTCLIIFSLSNALAATAPDLEKGKSIFNRCVVCHNVKPVERNGIGPNLFGVFGRKAGQRTDLNAKYVYSGAMQNAKVIWNEKTLDDFLKDPKGFIPGTKMIFAKMNESDRRNLINYMKIELKK